MGLLLELLISIESFLGSLVEGLKISNLWSILQEVGEVLVQFLNEHTELGTPITYVIGSLHLMAQELEYSAYSVSLDGGSKMPNMHVLSNIWTRKINYYSLSLSDSS